MRRNRGVIYTGKVGSRLRPKRWRFTRKTIKHKVFLLGGPLGGYTVWLSKFCDGRTLPIKVGGSTGRYVQGSWVPA